MTRTGNIQPSLDYEEHAKVGNDLVGAKKVVVIDTDGNQIVDFGSKLLQAR